MTEIARAAELPNAAALRRTPGVRPLAACAAVSLLLALCCAPAFPPESGFLIVPAAVLFLCLILAAVFCDRIVILPFAWVIFYVLQHVAAPVYAWWRPESVIGWPRTGEYARCLGMLSWGALIAALGILVPLYSVRSIREPRRRDERLAPDAAVVRWAKIVLLVTVPLSIPQIALPEALAFVVTLLLRLRLVGYGVMIFTRRGIWWLLFAAAVELWLGLRTAMFHNFFIAAVGLACLYAWSRRWRWRMLGMILLGLASIYLIQAIKPALRQVVWAGDAESEVSSTEVFLNLVGQAVGGDVKLLSWETADRCMERLNQAKIIERCFERVPRSVPYFEGRTILDGVVAAVLPAAVAPWKQRAPSRETFTLVTGHPLQENVTMGLGHLGESYINFGEIGGLACFAVYSLAGGGLFVWWALRARRSPLWWVWFPYVFYWWGKFEGNIGSSLNYLVKAALIMLVVVLLSPAWRRQLSAGNEVRASAGPREEAGRG